MEVPDASAVDAAELEQVAALGWRGLEEEHLGDWLLRAGGGFTGRANSALALGAPGLPPADAARAVEGWYAARGLPALIQVPLPRQEELHADLLALGWGSGHSAEVLVGDVAAVLAGDFERGRSSGTVHLDARPTEAWLSLYHYRGGDLPPSAVDVMTRGDLVAFASIVRDGEVLAIGRGAVAEGWVGLTAIEVAASARRRGLGGQVVRALLAWGDASRARSTYLQVSPDNFPALALYSTLGYVHHHRYVYLTAP